MLFMKGNKLFPQCGFSNTAVMILKAVTGSAGCDFETFDVLSDQDVSARAESRTRRGRRISTASAHAVPYRPQVREGIKAYSNWPTIPQCYIEGEFVGGCDLLIEMYQSGEVRQPSRSTMRHPPRCASRHRRYPRLPLTVRAIVRAPFLPRAAGRDGREGGRQLISELAAKTLEDDPEMGPTLRKRVLQGKRICVHETEEIEAGRGWAHTCSLFSGRVPDAVLLPTRVALVRGVLSERHDAFSTKTWRAGP